MAIEITKFAAEAASGANLSANVAIEVLALAIPLLLGILKLITHLDDATEYMKNLITKLFDGLKTTTMTVSQYIIEYLNQTELFIINLLGENVPLPI